MSNESSRDEAIIPPPISVFHKSDKDLAVNRLKHEQWIQAQAEIPGNTFRCDFCNTPLDHPDGAWKYDVPDFNMIVEHGGDHGVRTVSTGGWAACGVCHDILNPIVGINDTLPPDTLKVDATVRRSMEVQHITNSDAYLVLFAMHIRFMQAWKFVNYKAPFRHKRGE